MELPRSRVDAAQIRDDHHGILVSIIALALQDRGVVVDRIAGAERELVAAGDGLPRGRRGGRGSAVSGTNELRLARVQREPQRPRSEVEDGFTRMLVRGDTPPRSEGNAQ